MKNFPVFKIFSVCPRVWIIFHRIDVSAFRNDSFCLKHLGWETAVFWSSNKRKSLTQGTEVSSHFFPMTHITLIRPTSLCIKHWCNMFKHYCSLLSSHVLIIGALCCLPPFHNTTVTPVTMKVTWSRDRDLFSEGQSTVSSL